MGMNKGKRMKRHLMDAKEVLGMVNKIAKALSGPVAEKGDKKLTGGEGAQDDQAFAVAHGPDNYDALVHKAESLQMDSIVNMTGRVAKQVGNMNLPGNLKEHLQKALAAIHGREIFDPRYKQACTLLKKVCDLMETIEKEAEVTEGNSAAMIPGMGGMRDMSEQVAPHEMKAIRRAIPKYITNIHGKKVKLTAEDHRNREQRESMRTWMNEKNPPKKLGKAVDKFGKPRGSTRYATTDRDADHTHEPGPYPKAHPPSDPFGQKHANATIHTHSDSGQHHQKWDIPSQKWKPSRQTRGW